MQKSFNFALFVFVVSLTVNSYAVPNITGIKGTLYNYSEIIINGEYFGDGPNVILFDDFEKGEIGKNVMLDSPVVGAWTGYGTTIPTVGDTARSGEKSMEIYVATDIKDDQTFKQVKKEFDSAIHEIFLSYWVRIPEGTNFPTAIEPRTMANESAWKFVWLMDGDKGYLGDDDYCIPTAVGSKFYLAGNDGYIYKGYPRDWKTQFNISQNWWTFDGWMRISAWLYINHKDRNPSPAFDDLNAYNSKVMVEFLTEGVGTNIDYNDHVRVGDGKDNSNDNNISQWTNITFPGWIRYGKENLTAYIPNCRPVYDDIYIATGDNSQARIEIGNAALWADCTNKALLIPSKWTSTEIAATVHLGNFNNGAAYLYVIDKDGNVNSKGYAINITSGTKTLSPPDPVYKITK